MTLNRELYFSIKAGLMLVHLAFLMVSAIVLSYFHTMNLVYFALWAYHLGEVVGNCGDMVGFINKNFKWMWFKVGSELLSFSLMVILLIYYLKPETDSASLVEMSTLGASLPTWILVELSFYALVLVLEVILYMFIYCTIQSPPFQYKYFYSLRNFDNEEDEHFKNQYFS
jgi:hypothetical protein